MGSLPEDDVPTISGTLPVDGDGADDTTTAEAGPPAAHLRHSRPPPLPSSRQAPSQPPSVIASSMPPRTLTGPIASTVPVATGSEGDLSELELEDDDEGHNDDETEDSITTMAPRARVSTLAGPPIPSVIAIRDAEDELLDETEVRTLPGHLLLEVPGGLRSRSQPRPAAGVPAAALSPDTQPEENDGVTTQALAPRAPTAPDLAALGILSGVPSTEPDEPSSEVLTRPGLADPETRPGLADPETRPGHASLSDDIVTTRGLVPEPYAEEGDSVTTQAPAFSEALIAAAKAGVIAGPKTVGDATLDDLTEGTTKKLRHPHKKAESLPAESDSESITFEAPAPLTNILRVIAADQGTPENGVAALEYDELPENRTAVMANAPLQRIVGELTASPNVGAALLPPTRPTGPGITLPHGSSAARAAAPQLTPSSESGLRIARPPEQTSLAALGVADPRASGVARSSPQPAVDPRPYAETESAFPAQPSVHDLDPGKGPRYGLVVAIVAAVSFVVPVTLFVVLRGHPEELAIGVPAEAATELQGHDSTPRGKLDRKALAAAAAASASASAAAASASASTAASARRPPHHR